MLYSLSPPIVIICRHNLFLDTSLFSLCARIIFSFCYLIWLRKSMFSNSDKTFVAKQWFCFGDPEPKPFYSLCLLSTSNAVAVVSMNAGVARSYVYAVCMCACVCVWGRCGVATCQISRPRCANEQETSRSSRFAWFVNPNNYFGRYVKKKNK